MAFEVPTDNYGHELQITPKGTSLARTVNASISSSVEITLQPTTGFIRVYAINQDVYLRWGIEDCNANTFDEVIPSGQIVDLVIPVDESGNKYTALNVIERTTSAIVIVVEK